MSSTNQGPEYLKSEKQYLSSVATEDRIYWLEEMIKHCPKHKSSEKMLAELRTRLKKLQLKHQKNKKKSGGKRGIRKEGFQFVLVGKMNTGKSTLLKTITHAKPLIAEYPYTTKTPEIGTFTHEGVHAQIIDLPSIGSDYYDSGIVNTADCIIQVITTIEELPDIEQKTQRAHGKRITVITKADLKTEHEKRKEEAKIKSKRIHGALISSNDNYGIQNLKEIMFREMSVIRIYMKEPGRPKQPKPMVLKQGSLVKDVAEHILKGFSAKITETRLTGPSSKFPNQRVGLNHKLADKDIIEFHAR